ncbi:AP-1-like transcription factor [Sphaceloma murrayae]|uniref:Restriction of telomere capping protein 4 n=1 Tax=Sphaceloma murrayae TaxID=2082308 RepID=A0A2K1R3G6_9PEZI|nr:AP-1-like transcription factor [Sphaceloma murrayae]
MNPLPRRRAPRLLRIVKGQRHATSNDHHRPVSGSSSPLSSPPHSHGDGGDEDIFREPDSSSDEIEQIEDPAPLTSFVKNTNIHASRTARTDGKGAADGKENGSHIASAKRKQDASEPDWMVSSSSQPKRLKNTYGSQPQRSQTTFKKPTSSSSPKAKPKATFKRLPGHASPQSSPPEARSSGSAFRHPPPAPLSLPTSHPTLSSSPPASPLSSAPSDIEEINPPTSTADSSSRTTTPCPICSAPTSLSFRVDWELENCRGRRMNLRLQERFCQAHQAASAAETWRTAKYPDVDWEDLETRLQRHGKRIEEVLDGTRESVFRKELEEKVKMRKSRTVKKMGEEGGTVGKTGYYGSRGGRIMTDFALGRFAGRLRRVAGRDGLLATSGVAGGVSGFVQAIVVPELALSLIMEDMGLNEEEAKEILEGSAEVGDLLNAEEERRVPAGGDSPPPPTYGADGMLDGAADLS